VGSTYANPDSAPAWVATDTRFVARSPDSLPARDLRGPLQGPPQRGRIDVAGTGDVGMMEAGSDARGADPPTKGRFVPELGQR
jgi:hypothetical protein